MPNVKTRLNMIIGDAFIPFGSIIDEAKIPPEFRKRKFIVRPGERDFDAERFKMQEEQARVELEPIIEEDRQTEEDSKRIILANKRAMRRE